MLLSMYLFFISSPNKHWNKVELKKKVKWLFKANEDFSVLHILLIYNVKYLAEKPTEVYLVALPILKIISVLCNPFKIYCTKRKHFPSGPEFLKSCREALIA